MLKEILTQLHQVKITLNKHGRRLNNITNLLETRTFCNSSEPESPPFSFPPQLFPLKTLEDMSQLEEMMEDTAGKRELVYYYYHEMYGNIKEVKSFE